MATKTNCASAAGDAMLMSTGSLVRAPTIGMMTLISAKSERQHEGIMAELRNYLFVSRLRASRRAANNRPSNAGHWKDDYSQRAAMPVTGANK